jgi:DNA end-binding protein Ku
MARRLGIGTVTLYGRESLVAVGSQPHGGLLLYTLHHAAELRAWDPLPANPDTSGKESTIARQIIAGLTRPLNLAAFTDAYQADLRRLIDAKIAGEEIVASPIADVRPVLDLQAALTASLAAVKKIPAKATPPATRKRAS